ncbi:MAG: DEAD/DEAH box helicase, partial [Thermomicrobiales bacterium]
ANPDEEKPRLSKEQNAEVRWSHTGTEYRFELMHPGGSERIERLLGVSQLRVGDRISIVERWSVDTRLPVDEQTRFQTTAKQLFYGDRAEIVGFDRELNADGTVRRVLARLKMVFGQFSGEPGFVFSGRPRVFEEGVTYTIEPDPNDVMLSRGRKLAKALQDGSVNALVERLGDDVPSVNWPVEAAQGQARFLAGIHAWIETGDLHSFEESKQRFIGELGDASTVLVQGPPGTGKSYTTAFAIWARIQGALTAGIPLRAMVSCKTHAATAVLLRNIADIQSDLKLLSLRHRELFSTFFDERLLDVPVYRFDGREPAYPGIRPIYSKSHAANEGTKATDVLMARDHLVVGMTPGGNWRLISDRWKDLFANRFIQLVVLDEASQMGLPEAIMATLTLDLEGQLIVVGDQRQMPPIVQHDWANEARRAFKQFAAFESLYLALDRRVEDAHKIKFAESFRLHRDMAEFLRREIYQQDGIPYFSRKTGTISPPNEAGAMVEAALGPEPLTIILHDEQGSQTSNPFEETLVGLLVRGLNEIDGIDPAKDVGVVVPHRSQRSALQERIPFLTTRDPASGEIVRSAVDTVERFQGDERRVILVSLTESDPTFIRSTSEFLLDPRRLTVALSRAMEKMIVIASRSVFELIATDETTFANAGLWKNFLKRTCTRLNWSGEIDSRHVDVWVNPPLVSPEDRE